jgi:hypothetical protein
MQRLARPFAGHLPLARLPICVRRARQLGALRCAQPTTRSRGLDGHIHRGSARRTSWWCCAVNHGHGHDDADDDAPPAARRGFLRIAHLLARFHQGVRFNCDNGYGTASWRLMLVLSRRRRPSRPRPCFNLSTVRRSLVYTLCFSALPMTLLLRKPHARFSAPPLCSATALSSAPLPKMDLEHRDCPWPVSGCIVYLTYTPLRSPDRRRHKAHAGIGWLTGPFRSGMSSPWCALGARGCSTRLSSHTCAQEHTR